MRNAKLRSVVIVCSGNFLEMYDFMVFGYYAAAIGKAFFPSDNPFLSLMLSLMTFGAGFLMRPLGAIVLGSEDRDLAIQPVTGLGLGGGHDRSLPEATEISRRGSAERDQGRVREWRELRPRARAFEQCTGRERQLVFVATRHHL